MTGETFPALTSDPTLQGACALASPDAFQVQNTLNLCLLPCLFFVGFPHLEPGWECPLSIKIAGTCEYYFTWPREKKIRGRLLRILEM